MLHGKPEQHVLEQLGIRTMAKAKYATENIGHYGLGFENYCHFTSPIRRYPDVMVHRVLQQVIEQNIIIDKKWMKNANIAVKGKEQRWKLKGLLINISR